MQRAAMRIASWVGLGLALLAFAGCDSLLQINTDTRDKNIEGLRINREQMRMQARAMINPLTGQIIDTADRIIAETDDSRIELAALEWKSRAVPIFRETLFAPQPQVAVLDALALSYQLMGYFETGLGAQEFGPYAPQAFMTAKAINEQIIEYMNSVTEGDRTNNVEAVIKQWAEENPIEGSLKTRKSIYSAASEISLRLGMSLGKAVDTVVTQIDDLNLKLDVLSAQLPEQARWQVEILAEEMVNDPRLADSIERINPMLVETESTLKEAQKTMAALPNMFQSERTIVLDDLNRKLDHAINALSTERKATMAGIAEERKAVMADIERNRIALTEDLRAQVLQFERTLTEERKAIISDVDTMRQGLIDEGFRYLVVLLASLGIYVTALVAIVLYMLDRRVWNPRRETQSN